MCRRFASLLPDDAVQAVRSSTLFAVRSWPSLRLLSEQILRPATPEEVEQSLAFALQRDGRKAFRLSGESMAKITAAHLLRSLERSGFVLMKRPPAVAHTTPRVEVPFHSPRRDPPTD